MHMLLSEYKTNIVLVRNAPGNWDGKGNYVEGAEVRITFEGSCLPLSDNDFSKNPDGGYTADDRKVYCEIKLVNGDKVIFNGFEYQVDSEREYPTIDNDFKRYFVKKVGVVNG